MLRLYASPTEEIHDLPLLPIQRRVPLRVWDAVSADGLPIDLYVFTIVPRFDADKEKFVAALPPFMVPEFDLRSCNHVIGQSDEEGRRELIFADQRDYSSVQFTFCPHCGARVRDEGGRLR